MNAKKLPRREAAAATRPTPVPCEPETKPAALPAPKVQPAEAEPEPKAPKTANSMLLDVLEDHYLPSNCEEREFVAKLAACRLSAYQRQRVFESVEAAIYARQSDPANWKEADFTRLALADSYRQQAEEALERAQKNVDQFIRQRMDDCHWVTTHELSERYYELSKRQYEISVRGAALREQRTADATASR